MESFTAIDFETVQGNRWSICQVGLVRVVNGIITKEINLLFQPPDIYYWSRFTAIHGISAKDTANAPTFDKVWHQIAPYIEYQNVVAHKETGVLSSHSTHEVLKTFYLDPKILSTIEEAALKIQVFGT